MARIIQPFLKFMNKAGTAALADGYLYFYTSGTTTPKTTYSDALQTIQNTNPKQLTSEGWAGDVFGSGTYRVDAYDDLIGSGGVLQQSFDPVGGAVGIGPFEDWTADAVYDQGDIVTGSDGKYYRSRINSNSKLIIIKEIKLHYMRVYTCYISFYRKIASNYPWRNPPGPKCQGDFGTSRHSRGHSPPRNRPPYLYQHNRSLYPPPSWPSCPGGHIS